MTTIELKTESYLFDSADGQFRTIPFYELSIDEWVIFQNGQPKYFLDFNRRTSPLIVELKNRMERGENLDSIVYKLGKYLGLNWTTNNGIQGKEVKGSYQPETTILKQFDDFSEIALELIFVATNRIEPDELMNDNKMFDKYLIEDENGQLRIEHYIIDGEENLYKFLYFVFGMTEQPKIISKSTNKELINLSESSTNCISVDDLDNQYKHWIELSERENSMDEYGSILGVIDYVRRNFDKKHLLLRTEMKSAFPISTIPKKERSWWKKILNLN